MSIFLKEKATGEGQGSGSGIAREGDESATDGRTACASEAATTADGGADCYNHSYAGCEHGADE